MRFIKAKYNGICTDTGKTIAKGELCLYCPVMKKVFHETSTRFKNRDEAETIKEAEDATNYLKGQESIPIDLFSSNNVAY